MDTKKNYKIDTYTIIQSIKLALMIIALIIAYFYVLNGRYMYISDDYLFDKWDKSKIYIKRAKIV